MKNKLYYFGCIREAGHYLWTDEGNEISLFQNKDIPFMIREHIDTGFCPKPQWILGPVRITHVDDWIIVSWWDNSVDSRPGSHSTFLGQGFESEMAVIDAAKKQFPNVFARQRVKLQFGEVS